MPSFLNLLTAALLGTLSGAQRTAVVAPDGGVTVAAAGDPRIAVVLGGTKTGAPDNQVEELVTGLTKGKSRNRLIGNGRDAPVLTADTYHKFAAGSEVHILTHSDPYQGQTALHLWKGRNDSPSNAVIDIYKHLVDPGTIAPSTYTSFHIWACHLRPSPVEEFPKNTIFFAHGTPDHSTPLHLGTHEVMKRWRNKPHTSPLEAFQYYFMRSPESLTMLSRELDLRYSFEAPATPLTTAQTVREFLRGSVSDYHDYLRSRSLPLPQEGVMPQISDMDAENYAKNAVFVHASRANSAYVRGYFEHVNTHPYSLCIGQSSCLLDTVLSKGDEQMFKDVLKKARMFKDTPKKSLSNTAPGINEEMLRRSILYNHTSFVPLILDNGVNTGTVYPDGFTFLHLAALMGNKDIAKVLLDAGVDIDTLAKNGVSALETAIEKGHTSTALFLMERGASTKTTTGRSLAQLAKKTGQLALAVKLERAAKTPSRTPKANSIT